jgi:hypothetical protein
LAVSKPSNSAASAKSGANTPSPTSQKTSAVASLKSVHKTVNKNNVRSAEVNYAAPSVEKEDLRTLEVAQGILKNLVDLDDLSISNVPWVHIQVLAGCTHPRSTTLARAKACIIRKGWIRFANADLVALTDKGIRFARHEMKVVRSNRHYRQRLSRHIPARGDDLLRLLADGQIHSKATLLQKMGLAHERTKTMAEPVAKLRLFGLLESRLAPDSLQLTDLAFPHGRPVISDDTVVRMEDSTDVSRSKESPQEDRRDVL